MSYMNEQAQQNESREERMIEEKMIEEMVFTNHISMLCRQGMWRTNSGLYLSIKNMELSHINNTVRWLNRNSSYPCSEEFIIKMKNEINSRSGGE